MSGFDVTRADARRSRVIVVAVSLTLSAVLLAALATAGQRRDAQPATASAGAEPVAALTGETAANAQYISAAPAESAAAETSWTPPARPVVYAIERNLTALNQSAFSGCTRCLDTRHVSLTVPRGGTLAGVLSEAGADRIEAARAIAALGDVFDVRHLRAGQTVNVFVEPLPEDAAGPDGESETRLAGFSFRPDIERAITVAMTYGGEYRARETMAEYQSEFVMAAGDIGTSLYVDALQAGATDRVVVELAGILAYAIDFQRSIYPGDEFGILFERYFDSDGDTVRTGDILYARYDGRGEPLEFFRFETPDGIVGYYNADGESAQRLLMRTPINGARLSSHFGRRRHPILGYTRNHNGTDFAAPTGTPVFAAGNGVIERANRFGSFGNYVRIRHANGYETAYAHLNSFARGIQAGTRVRQGQVVAYVGTTGRSTGPHLHYEVHLNGRPVNPMNLDLPTGRRLEAEDLPLFEAERDRIREMIAQAPSAAGDRDIMVAGTNQPGNGAR